MPQFVIHTMEHIERFYRIEADSEAEARECFENNDWDDNQALLFHDNEGEEEEIDSITQEEEEAVA